MTVSVPARAADWGFPSTGALGSDVRVSDSRCPPPDDLLHHASLFLDFDGTLVEIARRPDAVQVDERLQNLMRTLAERLDGRIAVISGRPAEEVRGLLGELIITVAGSHGLEVSDAGGSETFAARPASLDRALPAMEELAGLHPGVVVEKKPFGAALHFREAPEAEARCLALASELAARHDLFLQPGKMVIERGGLVDRSSRMIRVENPHGSLRPKIAPWFRTDPLLLRSPWGEARA